MTTDTLEPEVKTNKAAEQLRLCADWLEQHDCDQAFYGVYTATTGVPDLHLRSLEEMKRLFPGCKATRKRDTSRYGYTLTVDGIRFLASEWLEMQRSDIEPVEVTL